MHTGGCGRPSLPGKCQQENAYGQCLPKGSKPELIIIAVSWSVDSEITPESQAMLTGESPGQ